MRRPLRGHLPTHLAVASLVLLACACAGTPTETTDAPRPAAATATDDGPPDAIVSLSPTATEVLFAIGAGDQVVAVDDQSDFPPEAPTTELSGFQPNVEAIAAYDPDLVIASGDPGDLVASLEAIDVPVLVHPAAGTLDDAWAQIEQVGAATGHVAEAAALVTRLQSELDELVASVDVSDAGLTYYHELDPSHYTVTSSTFIGEVYGLFGLTSIADAAEDDNGGYPQLSPEYIVEADPDLVFLADGECCDVTAEQVAARPGWDTVTAVRDGAITTLDEDAASRWGPRVVAFARSVAEALEAREPAAA